MRRVWASPPPYARAGASPRNPCVDEAFAGLEVSCTPFLRLEMGLSHEKLSDRRLSPMGSLMGTSDELVEPFHSPSP